MNPYRLFVSQKFHRLVFYLNGSANILAEVTAKYVLEKYAINMCEFV